jgi:hypothetical protein
MSVESDDEQSATDGFATRNGRTLAENSGRASSRSGSVLPERRDIGRHNVTRLSAPGRPRGSDDPVAAFLALLVGPEGQGERLDGMGQRGHGPLASAGR